MPEITDEELAKYKADSERAANLESSKKRLEDENTKIKGRAKEAEEKLSEAEKAKLEADGNKQALLDKSNEELSVLKGKYKTRTSDVLKEKLRTEVSKYAKDAHNIDMVLKVTEHKDLLKLDEETLSVEGVEEYVKAVRGTAAYLFGTKTLDTGDNTPPGGGPPPEPQTDAQKYQSELRAANTRKEMNEVRKKYGKPVD